MNIVFYSNNSNYFDSSTFFINSIPTWQEQFEQLQKNHPEHTFYAVTQKPGMFLPEESLSDEESNVFYLPQKK